MVKRTLWSSQKKCHYPHGTESQHRSECIQFSNGTAWNFTDDILLQHSPVSSKQKNSNGNSWAWKVTSQNSQDDLLKHMARGTKIACFCQTPQGETFWNVSCLELIALFHGQFILSTTWRQLPHNLFLFLAVNQFMISESHRGREFIWRWWGEHSIIWLCP